MTHKEYREKKVEEMNRDVALVSEYFEGFYEVARLHPSEAFKIETPFGAWIFHPEIKEKI